MQTTAARLTKHGKPLEVTTCELTEPAAGEVLVSMAFAGVNPVDRYGALGRVAPDGPLPRTLGGEGVGTVDGSWFVLRGHGIGTRRDGTWAHEAVVPEAALTSLPDGVQPVAAAAMGVAGVTAWRVATELAELSRDDRVLVLGAAGGVGSILVTIARASGATVWGQTASKEKSDWILAQGAHRAIATDASGLIEAVADLNPTVVFDGLGGDFTGAAISALADKGRLVLYGTSAGAEGPLPLQVLYRGGRSILGYGGLVEPDDVMARWMVETLRALADERLQVQIDSLVPLAQVNEAFDRLAARRVLGKLVLDLRR